MRFYINTNIVSLFLKASYGIPLHLEQSSFISKVKSPYTMGPVSPTSPLTSLHLPLCFLIIYAKLVFTFEPCFWHTRMHSMCLFHFFFFCTSFVIKLLEKGKAIHSTVLAWRIPWTEKPGGLQSMGLQRVGHDWETNTHTHNQTSDHEVRLSHSFSPLHTMFCLLLPHLKSNVTVQKCLSLQFYLKQAYVTSYHYLQLSCSFICLFVLVSFH